MGQPIVKNQHYVPRFILDNFATGKKDQLHVYDKKDIKKFISKSKNIASETYFYDFKIDGEEHSFEKGLGVLEGHCSKIITKIIMDGSLEKLSPQEFYDLAHFTAVQFTRTRKMRNMLGETQELILNHVKKMGYGPEKIQGYRPLDEEEARLFELHTMMDSIPKFTEIIAGKILTLLRAPPRSPFYISDHPVVMDNNLMEKSPHRSNVGLSVVGVEIYFPIHPSYTLCFMCPVSAQTIKDSYNKIFETMNVNPALLADMKLDSIFEMHETLFLKKPFKLRHENIIRMNSLQAKQSTRFIFSNNDDFSLLQEMQEKGHINHEGKTLGG